MPRRKRWRRRAARRAAWVLGVLLAGGAFTLWLALRPAALEARVRLALGEVLGCSFSFDSCRWSFARGVQILGLHLRDERDEDILRADRFWVVPRLAPLFLGRVEPARLELRDVDIHVARGAAGKWNLERICRPGLFSGGAGPERAPRSLAPPELVIENCRFEYRDEASFQRPVSLALNGLKVRVLAEEGPSESVSGASAARGFRFEAGGTLRGAKRLQLAGRWRPGPSGPVGEARLRLHGIDLAAPVVQALGGELRGLAPLSPRGTLDLAADLRLDADGGIRLGSITGVLSQGELALPGMPFPCHRLAGEIAIRPVSADAGGGEPPRILEARLTGELAGGSLRATATASLDSRTLRLIGWSGELRANGSRIDSPSESDASPAVAGFLARWKPRGRVDFTLSATDSPTWAPPLSALRARVDLQGVDFEFRGFPYLLSDAHASFDLEGGRWNIAPGARIRCGEGRVSIPESRFLVDLAAGGRVDAELEVEGFVLDERFRDAIPAGHRRIWDDLRPRGRIDAVVRIERGAAEEARVGVEGAAPARPVRVRVEARPTDMGIRYRHFPYAIGGIRGRVTYDSREGVVHLLDLAGHHGRHDVTGQGAVDLAERGRLKLELGCADLTVDRDLLDALPEICRKILGDFAFQGRVKLEKVAIDTGDPQTPVRIALELLEGSARHVGFPYPLRIAGGRFEVRGLGDITLQGWKTPPEFAPSIEFNGRIERHGERSEIRYDFQVSGLEVDDRLRSALPEPLRELIDSLGLEGTFSGGLQVSQVLDAGDPEGGTVHFGVTDVSSSNAAVRFGVDLSDISCVGNFVGEYRHGTAVIPAGDIVVREATFNRLHLRDGGIHFSFGSLHPLLRGERVGRHLPPEDFRLPEEVKTELLGRPVHDAFQMSVTTNRFYGGRSDGFIWVGSHEGARFDGWFTADGIDVREAASDVFGTSSERVAGRARGHVRFGGLTGESDSLSGAGEGTIEKARLAELPIFFNVLSLLKLRFDGSKGTTFDRVELPYRIEKDHFTSDRIEVSSSVLSLTGHGTLDFSGRIDMLLEPQIIPVRIPGVDFVFGLLKKALSEVRVRGDLADPKVVFVTAGGLLPIRIGKRSEPEADSTGRRGSAPAGESVGTGVERGTSKGEGAREPEEETHGPGTE